MEYEKFTTRYNIMDITSFETFVNIKGGVNHNCKDVYFIRAVGAYHTYLSDIEKMDLVLSERMYEGTGKYNRINSLPKLMSVEEISYYSKCYEEWKNRGKRSVDLKAIAENERLRHTLGNACYVVAERFKQVTTNVNDSIEKNFIVKLLYWLEQTGSDFLLGWNPGKSMKFVVSNVFKKQEYLFCYLLTLLGIDVLLLQSTKDIDAQLEELNLSKKIFIGDLCECNISFYDYSKYQKRLERKKAKRIHSTSVASVPQTRIQQQNRPVNVTRPEKSAKSNRRTEEMSFEELALLASSIVMIAIHDRKGQVVGTGSGIMIGRDGYILTNHHVANGGLFYSVRIEGEEQIYKTDEIIKYNPVLDLAIIRIERRLEPLTFYQGEKRLVRGQKVVAIGSPLGLFNSVSDGIISGFRSIDHVDMIQFTAPISHGSSGGAVLNMFGEVIGISTAGIDEGQNINLAVGYEYINNFIRGFVDSVM